MMMFIGIGLLFLATLFMPWFNFSRLNTARDDIKHLQRKLATLEAQSSDAPKAKVTVAATQKTIEVKQEAPPKPVQKTDTIPVPQQPKTDWAQKAQSSFEQNIATKLPVWIGAISLIFAAFFLVKYSIELGWLGPMVRVSLGTLFGFALLAAGQWVGPRKNIANGVRIGQALIGAGIVTLYVSIYAAINLYGLLNPVFGFGSMTAITALAVITSIRHGQPIAVFGLLGGLLTPALVGSDDPNAVAMFGYLFLLFSGMFTVLVRKGWWVLAVATLVGVLAWSAFWFTVAFAASDAIVLVIFAMAVTAVVLAVTGKHMVHNSAQKEDKLPIHGLNFTAIAGGALTLIWLSFEITLTLFDWSMFGLLSMAVMALAYFQPSIYQKPLLAKLGTTFILFFMWAQEASLGDSLTVLCGLSALYVGGGFFIMRRVSDPRFWAGVQAVSAIALYTIAYWVLGSSGENVKFLWGGIALILSGLAIHQAFDIIRQYTADDTIRQHLIAIYTLTASAFIALGLAIELPWGYVPLAIAGQITATAFIYQRTHINFLKTIMTILALVFAALNYEQFILFTEIILSSIVGDSPSTYSIGSYVLDAPLIKLGLSSILISVALWIAMKIDNSDEKFVRILLSVASIFGVMTVYYALRSAFHADALTALSTHAGFIERGIITMTCAATGAGLLQIARRYDVSALQLWGAALFHLGMVRLAYFDVLINNPYWSKSQFVGDMPFLNGVTLTYGGGALLAAWAVYNKDQLHHKGLYKTLSLIALFAFSTLTVSQLFHGGYMMHGTIESAELYAYSVAWLVTGLGLLTFGIVKKNKTARMTSLAFIILAVLKVFLFDVAELEGLYRVFSFLGLGVSLIGLSYFYTKFVFSNQPSEDAA